MSPVFALGTIGHGRLVGNASVRGDYDSNVFVNNTQVDDYIVTTNGSLRYVRDAGILTFEASVGATAYAFTDDNDQNSIDPLFEAKFGYLPSSKTELRGNLSFIRNTVANDAVNARTQSNDLTMDSTFQHLTTEKLGFRLTGNYSESAYRTTGYSDVFNYGLGVHGIHVYSPKLRVLAGVTMLEWWTDERPGSRASPSSQDWRYSLGLEGELAPKVSGDFNVGLVDRSIDAVGFSDDSSLFLSSRISWLASEKTTWSLLLSQNLSVSAADQSVKSLNASLVLRQTLTERVNFEGSAGIDRSRYSSFNNVGNRRDNGYILRGRLNYTLNDYVGFDVSSGYRNNDSNLTISDYDRFNIGAGVSVRF